MYIARNFLHNFAYAQLRITIARASGDRRTSPEQMVSRSVSANPSPWHTEYPAVRTRVTSSDAVLVHLKLTTPTITLDVPRDLCYTEMTLFLHQVIVMQKIVPQSFRFLKPSHSHKKYSLLFIVTTYGLFPQSRTTLWLLFLTIVPKLR